MRNVFFLPFKSANTPLGTSKTITVTAKIPRKTGTVERLAPVSYTHLLFGMTISVCLSPARNGLTVWSNFTNFNSCTSGYFLMKSSSHTALRHLSGIFEMCIRDRCRIHAYFSFFTPPFL